MATALSRPLRRRRLRTVRSDHPCPRAIARRMAKNSCAVSTALTSSGNSRPGKKTSSRSCAQTMAQLQVDLFREPDIADRASSETDWGIQLRTRDRQRKLIAKIDCAIRRLYEGEYGYCEVTGEPISLARLEARPIATMTLEAQERHERIERVIARRLIVAQRAGDRRIAGIIKAASVSEVAGQFVLQSQFLFLESGEQGLRRDGRCALPRRSALEERRAWTPVPRPLPCPLAPFLSVSVSPSRNKPRIAAFVSALLTLRRRRDCGSPNGLSCSCVAAVASALDLVRQ